MRASSDQLMERTRARVAREYRRDGYRVIRPGDPAALPEFLQGFRPTLIAERDDDHVVIEIRTTRSLKGDKEFVALAERIERLKGWRLEFISLPYTEEMPDWRPSLDRFLKVTGDPGFGMPDARAVYLISTLEVLLDDLARRCGLNTRDMSARRMARELVFRGIIDEPMLADIDDAIDVRNKVVHRGPNEPPPQADDLGRLMKVCERLYECLALEDVG